MRRDTDRAADIRAEFECREPAGDGGGRTSGGAARDPIQRPRVVRRPEQVVERLDVTRPSWHVGLAEHDRARGFETRNGRGVDGRNVGGQLGRSAGRAHASDLDGVFDRDRQPVQRAQPVAARGRFVCSCRGRVRPFAIESHDRVDRWPELVDAREICIEQLSAGEASSSKLVL